MTYQEQLYPWCIIRSLPNNQTVVVARFRNRSDAEAQLQLLHQLSPRAAFSVVFEPINSALDQEEPAEEKPEADSST